MKRKAAKPALPRLATTIPSLLGPVTVVRQSGLRDTENGEKCLGLWRSAERLVKLEADSTLEVAWHTYWHEWVHVALYDVGVKLDDKIEEQICDVLATARVREMLDNGSRL